MELFRIVEEIKQLSTDDRFMVLKELIKDEKVSVTELIVAKVYNLEEFKKNAIRDITKVAEAGMELGEREMRAVTKISGYTRKKDDSFKLAMVKCLIDAGAYKGTAYGDEIAAADFSSIDKDWYEWSWKPATTKEGHPNA